MEIADKIRQFIISNLYYTEGNYIAEEDSFLETGVVDSMGVMELVAFIQAEFGVEVEQQEIVVENFDSIRKLTDYVRRKLQSKSQRVAASNTTVPGTVPAPG